MRGRICSTSRGVNALETSARSRVWSGGSRSSMLRASGRNIAGTHGCRATWPGVSAFNLSLTRRSSFRAAATSS